MNIIISCLFLAGMVCISIYSFCKKDIEQGKAYLTLATGMAGVFYYIYISKNFDVIFYIFIIIFIVGFVLTLKWS